MPGLRDLLSGQPKAASVPALPRATYEREPVKPRQPHSDGCAHEWHMPYRALYEIYAKRPEITIWFCCAACYGARETRILVGWSREIAATQYQRVLQEIREHSQSASVPPEDSPYWTDPGSYELRSAQAAAFSLPIAAAS